MRKFEPEARENVTCKTSLFHIIFSDMLSPVRLSSVCNARAPDQAVEIFGNISAAFGTLAIR